MLHLMSLQEPELLRRYGRHACASQCEVMNHSPHETDNVFRVGDIFPNVFRIAERFTYFSNK